MTAWPREDQQRVVRDLTKFFNAIAADQYRPTQAVDIRNETEWKARLVRDVTTDFAKIVDFHVEKASLNQVVRANGLGSMELAAIEMVAHIDRRGLKDEAVPVMYRVMEEISVANKIGFGRR